MTTKQEGFTEKSKQAVAITAMVLLIGASPAANLVPRSQAKEPEMGNVKMESENSKIGMRNAKFERQTEEKRVTTQSRFYCNINALTTEERAHHKQLSQKLIAARKKIVETTKGYEFQFSPRDVSLAELAEWVVAESKCCPFFDFHIDLENEGSLLCLRLTGDDGIKEFIRAEFGVQ